VVKVLLTAAFLTKTQLLSSPFLIANNFLILLTLFGPNLNGHYTSVNPGISSSPFLTIYKDTTFKSYPKIHPLTDFLFLCPSLLILKVFYPSAIKILTLPLTMIPYLIGNPYLSFPPVILNTYPLYSVPKPSPSTSYPILLSYSIEHFLSSSISTHFYDPV